MNKLRDNQVPEVELGFGGQGQDSIQCQVNKKKSRTKKLCHVVVVCGDLISSTDAD